MFLMFSLYYLVQNSYKHDRIGPTHFFLMHSWLPFDTVSTPDPISSNRKVRSHGKIKSKFIKAYTRKQSIGSVLICLHSNLAL